MPDEETRREGCAGLEGKHMAQGRRGKGLVAQFVFFRLIRTNGLVVLKRQRVAQVILFGPLQIIFPITCGDCDKAFSADRIGRSIGVYTMHEFGDWLGAH
jgi:hypothetical protein